MIDPRRSPGAAGWARRHRAARAVAGVALALSGLAACTAYRQLIGEDTVSLEQAQALRMEVDLRRAVKRICPREPVQMWVMVDARLPGESSAARLETWEGDAKARRNGKLDFDNFTFTSEEGTVNRFGWFQPNGNVLATVERGFQIRTALRSRPDRFTEIRAYEPDYSCFRVAGRPGGGGSTGFSGSSGGFGTFGREGYSGESGGPGGPGQPGGPGEPGPRLTAFATYARTRFYPRLVAVRIEGDVRDLVLAPPDQELVLVAAGGPGGPGGPGGDGGDGGSGGRGQPRRSGGSGGDGGPGGPGGAGGSGGPGGTIELIYDGRFPELAERIRLDASGGPAGPGGPGGDGGDGGNGGSGGRDGGRQGRGGRGGLAGTGGSPGSPGPPGAARVRPGAVTEQFRTLPGIQPL